jgi:hypothetical protein
MNYMSETSDITDQIQSLVKASGKSASQMTQALSHLGGGDMQSGIDRLADFFLKEGMTAGTIRGALGGALGTAGIGALILLVRKGIKACKSHKTEGEAILKELEESERGNGEGGTVTPA